jgi:hypothetical protein
MGYLACSVVRTPAVASCRTSVPTMRPPRQVKKSRHQKQTSDDITISEASGQFKKNTSESRRRIASVLTCFQPLAHVAS